MNPLMLRRYGAEFLGTFAYVFFGCGTRIFIGYSGDLSGRLIIYITFGLTLFTMTYALGISLAHHLTPQLSLA